MTEKERCLSSGGTWVNYFDSGSCMQDTLPIIGLSLEQGQTSSDQSNEFSNVAFSVLGMAAVGAMFAVYNRKRVESESSDQEETFSRV